MVSGIGVRSVRDGCTKTWPECEAMDGSLNVTRVIYFSQPPPECI